MAQGTIDGAIEVGHAPSSIRREYDFAGVKAMQELTKHIPFPSEAFFKYMRAAMHRHGDGPGEAA
jgi:hypothetical protein